MMTITHPTHPDGEIAPYRDALDREQLAVDGPKGHVLITRNGRFEPYVVWFSDRLGAITRTTDYKRAVRTAAVAAGLDPAGIAWPEHSAADISRNVHDPKR